MTTVRQGLLFKRLTLLIGAAYFTLVTITDVVNLLASIGGYGWRVLDSGNVAYIESITKDYGLPSGFDELAVAGAIVVEAVGAALAMAVVIAVVPDDPTRRES